MHLMQVKHALKYSFASPSQYPSAEGSVCLLSDLAPLLVRADLSLELWNYSGGSNEDIPSVPWQSSACLFCLLLYPLPVLSARFNVVQSNGSSVFSAWQRKVLVQQADSNCDDCDPIKMWQCAKAVLDCCCCCSNTWWWDSFIASTDKVLMIISHGLTHQYSIVFYVFQTI